jgi:hypothetical protein
MSNEFNWTDLKEARYPINASKEDYNNNFKGEFLQTSLGIPELENCPYCFMVGNDHITNKTDLRLFTEHSSFTVHRPFHFEFDGDIDAAKKLVENTLVYFYEHTYKDFTLGDIIDHLLVQIDQFSQQQEPQNKLGRQQSVQQPPAPDRRLETAQKTGYVQGVCESVLAFNNEDNRKIMAESTMVFLSKKLLSEMNVTKDAAQKFARPETYKALEQCVFSSEQNQNLEQTKTRGRGL